MIIFICCRLTFLLVCLRNQPTMMNSDVIDKNSALDLFDCKIDVSNQGLITKHVVLTRKNSDDKGCFFLPRAHNTELNLTFALPTSCGICHHMQLKSACVHLMLRPD